MNRADDRQSPLQGMNVVDLTHVWSGPYCAMMLGELGAEVIKIEPFSGDQFRPTLDGCIFPNLNKNKRGIALNLKMGEGKEIALKLAGKADVLVENSIPGAMDRLGLGYEAIQKLNPRIVYCSISGFGQEGPFRERPAYDPVLQAMSGVMIVTGEADRPPVRILPGFIDHSTGVFAAFGILAALMEREKTGQGQRLDIALLDVALTAMSHFITRFKKTGKLPQRYGSATILGAPIQIFDTRDGFIFITANTDLMWKNLCKTLEAEELAKDPCYATVQSRTENRGKLAQDLNQFTKKYTRRALEEKLLAAGVPCSQVNNIGEIIEEPHVQSRQILEEMDFPSMGRITTLKTPIFYSGKNPSTKSRAPLLGEHTHEVLKELGYSDREIQDFIKKGAALQHQT